MPLRKPSKITGTIAFRLPHANLTQIDDAIEATPGLNRTMICQMALTRFLASEEFRVLKEGHKLKRA
jgi:hypothetical protein